MAPLGVRFRPEAFADIDAEVRFYSLKDDSDRLVARFLHAVENAVGKAAANSQAWPKVYREFRRVQFRRFPFSLYYIAYRERVEVFAVIHAKRDPSFLRERLK